jgi:hypothetical protein
MSARDREQQLPPQPSPILYRTAGGNITQADIDSGVGAAMAVSGGVLATKAVPKMGGILKAEAPFPQYAEAYPPTGPGVPTIDPKSGKPYMAKANTPEAEAFAATRNAIQKDMDANGYQPYFDPAQRFHADPSQYPPMLDTAQQLPKKMETILKYTHELDTPETRAALQQMYKAGQQGTECRELVHDGPDWSGNTSRSTARSLAAKNSAATSVALWRRQPAALIRPPTS